MKSSKHRAGRSNNRNNRTSSQSTDDTRQTLDRLKQQCPLPDLMKHLGFEKYAKPSCKSPFRTEQNASWGIFQSESGWHFKDHGTGESGDEITFLANHLNLDQRISFPVLLDVYKATASTLALNPHQPLTNIQQPPTIELPDRSGFSNGTDQQHIQLAQLRGFSVDTVKQAVERGVLVFGEWHNHQCYGITDMSGRLIEIRRLDGLNFPAVGELQERKGHAIKHSQKNWPIGLLEAEKATNILLAEGMPDFIAAHEVIEASPDKHQWAAVSILSASSQIAEDALPRFNGKNVLICFHNDSSSAGLKAAIKWRQQLQSAGAKVRLLDTRKLSASADNTIKDLNDYIKAVKSAKYPQLPQFNLITSL